MTRRSSGYIVKNTGNVALDVSLSPTRSLTLGLSCDPGILAANDGAAGGLDEFTCEATGTWAAGQQTNTASVSGTFTDGSSDAETATDSDDANYFGADRLTSKVCVTAVRSQLRRTPRPVLSPRRNDAAGFRYISRDRQRRPRRTFRLVYPRADWIRASWANDAPPAD